MLEGVGVDEEALTEHDEGSPMVVPCSSRAAEEDTAILKEHPIAAVQHQTPVNREAAAPLQ